MGNPASLHERKCPFLLPSNGTTNKDWWPEQLNVKILSQNNERVNPIPTLDYASEFANLDFEALKGDLRKLMTDSQNWWPADYGHYGPFFVRMAWHSAGTYRIYDGRGGAGAGQMRFAPLNSWPDNTNLDKALRLLWPIKQKYGQKISWGDLIILTGNVALESMGFETFGFAGGREDVWEPEDDVNWGKETTWLSDNQRYKGDRQLEDPLGAVQMGLIYVNPEGPGGNPDPLASAQDIRETFRRMAMNDEETVALVAGGHTFGKSHGAGDASHLGVEPEGAAIEQQGLGWKNTFRTGKGEHTITSGLEGAWTASPTKWDSGYFDVLFGYEWELTKSPAGASQWRPKGTQGKRVVPDAHNPSKRHQPMMLTSDLALRMDPVYNRICRRFHHSPEEFRVAFAKAWYKLTHRDMGPYSRCLGPEVPPPQPWQDPIPRASHPPMTLSEQAILKKLLLKAGLKPSELVETAWASAFTFRSSDKRGGANGARIRLEPQCGWEVNKPDRLFKILTCMEHVQKAFNMRGNGSYVSMADLIVLGGCLGVEVSAKKAGYDIRVPFTPGRSDATQSMTDVDSFRVLQPVADGFRNYIRSDLRGMNAAELLIDKAYLLNLSAPEMTVLLGGLRVLGIGAERTSSFTNCTGTLTNDFFINLLDSEVEWRKAGPDTFEGHNRKTGKVAWTGTAVDMTFGSHSILRSLSEVYASDDAGPRFASDFCRAFAKVMELDRFDVPKVVEVRSRI